MSNDLDTLVPEWLTLSDVADRLGVSVGKVRQLIRERELLAVPHGPNDEPGVPAAFISGDRVLKGMQGTLTVLHDAGFDAESSVRWLFTVDPVFEGGTPMAALVANRGKEVRRQAQAMAF